MIYSFIPARPCSAGPRRIAWEVKPCFAASVRPCLKPVRLVPLLRDCADVVVTFSNTRKKFKKKKTLGYGFGARALSVRAGCGEGSDRNGYEKKKKSYDRKRRWTVYTRKRRLSCECRKSVRPRPSRRGVRSCNERAFYRLVRVRIRRGAWAVVSGRSKNNRFRRRTRPPPEQIINVGT